jgi:phosphoribosyl 1,2-cyclic phosphodiesterase
MKVTVWGSRGSLANCGPETIRYGGNTACVEVAADETTTLVLDAGTGLRRAGGGIGARPGVIHILLTHLHMDHIQGLGFFRPLFEEGREIHIWGPPSTTLDLRARLTRYLSPPLFPVRIRDLSSHLELHDTRLGTWRIGAFELTAAAIIHPGPTVGYRIDGPSGSLAYLPDHEPALGGIGPADWTSGYRLARDVDLLIHDAQYGTDEYPRHVGWGHSSASHALTLAELARSKRLALFHHDPDHDDDAIDAMLDQARSVSGGPEVLAAREGMTIAL